MISGVGGDCHGTEASQGIDFCMDRVTCLVHGKGCDNGNHVLGSAACLVARPFSAEAGSINLDLSTQDTAVITLGHGPQNLVVK